MQSLVRGHVRYRANVGTVRWSQSKDLCIQLFLDLVNRLVLVRLTEYHDDQTSELGNLEKGALLYLIVDVHFTLNS